MSTLFRKPETLEERKARLERIRSTVSNPDTGILSCEPIYPGDDETKYPEAIIVHFLDGTHARYTAAGDSKQ